MLPIFHSLTVVRSSEARFRASGDDGYSSGAGVVGLGRGAVLDAQVRRLQTLMVLQA
jgi:hypothetical protein